MRAPYLVLLFALCLPLQAGDPADLNSAVEMFRSPRPAVRAEGSRLADKELRKLLAPLLKAMKDQDPEVRRRVREAILGLVPNHGREPAKPQQGQRLFALGKVGLQFQWVNKNAMPAHLWIQLPGALGANDAVAQASVMRLGLIGKFVLLPKHGRCFRIDEVKPNSAAAKIGLIAGDTILTINKQAVNSWANFLKAIGKQKSFAGSTLKGLRGNASLEIVVR